MENAGKQSINLRNLREKLWNLWLHRENVKFLPQSSRRNAQSSQSYILRRFA